MKISKRSENIKTSLTRSLFNMAQMYDNVIDLTLGDPDLPPPKELSYAAYEAMKNNKLHYSANAGLIEARRAVSQNIKKIWNINSDPNEELIITVGGMEALYLSLLSIIDEGDDVIVFAPYYVNYVQMVELCGGKTLVLDVYDAEKGISIDKAMLDAVITDKTIAVIINSPNNPTGDIMNKETLQCIAEFAYEHDLVVISDEVYRTLLYDNMKHESILQFEESRGRTILVDSLSKEYSMTGWRIGYAYGPKEIIASMTKLQENVAACASLASQYALTEAYNTQLSNEYIIHAFETRRDYLFNEISKFDQLTVIKPKGTFYMFINIAKTGLNSEEFSYKLLEKSRIAVVPGIAYGDMYDSYIRVAFTKNIAILKEVIERLKKFFGS